MCENLVKTNSELSNLELSCSCTKCDSLLCFAYRNKPPDGICTCFKCKEAEICLYHNNNVVKKFLHNVVTDVNNKSDQNSQRIKNEGCKVASVESKQSKELRIVNNENNPEPNLVQGCKVIRTPSLENKQFRNIQIIKNENNPNQKCIESCKVLHTPCVEKKQPRIIRIIKNEYKPDEKFIVNKQVTPTIIKEKTVKENFKHIVYTTDNTNNKTRIISEKSKFSYTSKHKLKEEFPSAQRKTSFNEGNVTEVNGVYNYPRKDVKAGAAKLSAQIMNVPYNEFNESYNQSENTSYQALKLSTFEVFKRIQEAYKACTCKICECIVGKTTAIKTEKCDCTPCDCEDCKAALRSKLKPSCYCETKYILNEPHFNFKPCECIDCTAESQLKSCDCEICHCMVCKSKATLKRGIIIATAEEVIIPRRNFDFSPCDCESIVLTAEGDIPRKDCDCSPCECASIAATTEKDIKRKDCECSPCESMSIVPTTEKNIPLQDCDCSPCECASIVGTTDKDIPRRNCECSPCGCATIVATTKKDIPLKDCDCSPCECANIVATTKEDITRRNCDCSPCECASIVATTKEDITRKNCNCSPCECAGIIATKDDKQSRDCDCSPCECAKIVATTEKDIPLKDCDCSLCECASFGKSYFINPKTHEISTGIDRHANCQCESCDNEVCLSGADLCKCGVRNSIINKPFARNNLNYDIHLASVNNNRYINSNEKNKSKHDSITMFRSLSNNYKKCLLKNIIEKNYASSGITNKSVYYNDRVISWLPEELERRSKERYKTPINTEYTSDKYCDCSPCEWKICSKKQNMNNHYTKKLQNNFKENRKCISDFCNCLMCQRLERRSNKVQDNKSTNICKCELCECIECKNIMAKCKEDIFHPINCLCNRCRDNSKRLEKLQIPQLSSYDKLRGYRAYLVDHKEEPVNKIENTKNGWNMKTNSSKDVSIYHINSDDTADSSTEGYNSSYTTDLTHKPHLNSYKNQNAKASINLNKKYDKYEDSISSHRETGYSSDSQTFARLNFGLDSKDSFSNDDESTSHSSSKRKKALQPQLSWGNYYKSFQEIFQHRKHLDKTTIAKCLNDVLEERVNLDKFEISAPVIIEEQYKSPASLLLTYSNKGLGDKNVEVEINNKISKCKKINVNSSYSELFHKYDNFKEKTESVKVLNTKLNNNLEKGTQTSGNETYNYDQRNIDFLRVQNTLRKAREFSFNLINLLLKYERANNNFKSISNRLRQEQISKFKDIFESAKDSNKIMKAKTATNLNSLSTDYNITLLRLTTNSRFDYNKNVNDVIIGNKEYDCIDQKSSQDFEDNINYRKPIQNARLENYSSTNKGKVNFDKFPSETASNIKNARIVKNNKEIENDNIDTSNWKGIGSMLTNNIEKKIDLVEETRIYDNIHQKIEANIKPTDGLQQSRQEIIDFKVKESLNMPKKNPLITLRQSELPIFSNCEEVSDVQPTKFQVEGKICQDNLTECTMKQPFKDLLTVPTLAAIKKRYILEKLLLETNISDEQRRFTSCRNSCEELKVCSLSLRRVSDHTVLVKWKIPKKFTDILGYELSVDGRAVQKIFSPSRRMAVITCLPNNEKVLLSIRTITSTPTDAGHRPTAAVVYRPRLK